MGMRNSANDSQKHSKNCNQRHRLPAVSPSSTPRTCKQRQRLPAALHELANSVNDFQQNSTNLQTASSTSGSSSARQRGERARASGHQKCREQTQAARRRARRAFTWQPSSMRDTGARAQSHFEVPHNQSGMRKIVPICASKQAHAEWSGCAPRRGKAESWHMFEAVCGRALIGHWALIASLKLETEIEIHPGQEFRQDTGAHRGCTRMREEGPCGRAHQQNEKTTVNTHEACSRSDE